MSRGKSAPVSVRVIPNVAGSPLGKLADVELTFEADAGPLCGLKLIGFGIWERRNGEGLHVTFPARPWTTDKGDRRHFALLRPANGQISAQEPLRDFILEEYRRFEAKA